MMETARTSETSVDNYFTRQYIPEDKSAIHTRRHENFSLAQLAQQARALITSASKATETKRIRPCKITDVQGLKEGDQKVMAYFCHWFLRAVHSGVLDPKLRCFLC
jgi:hypothetical protein